MRIHQQEITPSPLVVFIPVRPRDFSRIHSWRFSFTHSFWRQRNTLHLWVCIYESKQLGTFSHVLHVCKQREHTPSTKKHPTVSNTFPDRPDVFCCTCPNGYPKSMHMYGSAPLEKRKIWNVFFGNNHIPLSQYRSSGCPYSGQKYVPSSVSSQDLVYRSSTRLIHKLQFTRAEVSDTKPLTILIPTSKYTTTTTDPWTLGKNSKVSTACKTVILLFSSMRYLMA